MDIRKSLKRPSTLTPFSRGGSSDGVDIKPESTSDNRHCTFRHVLALIDCQRALGTGNWSVRYADNPGAHFDCISIGRARFEDKSD